MAAASNHGSVSTLNLDAFQSQLSTRSLGRAPGWANELWDCIDSTNNRAAELAAGGAPAGVVIVARQQTAGRGRQGRTWISPPDSGLYASFLLRPRLPGSQMPMHTLACGVAAARAIESCVGIRIGLKWVNDLVYDGRKMGGILAEMPSVALPATTAGDLPPPLVLGIGMNLRFDAAEIPDELQDRIDWLERVAEHPVDPNQLLAFLARYLEEECDALAAGRITNLIDSWKQYSVTLGRTIRATSGTSTIEGVAVDLSESGGLVVKTGDGGTIVLHAGEVTIRGADRRYT